MARERASWRRGGVSPLTVAATLAADVHRDEERTRPRSARRAACDLDAARRARAARCSSSRASRWRIVTSQPDPLTVLVDLRNVEAGMLPPGILGPLPPVADVRVEEATAGDGAEVARVRVKLAYAAKHARAQRAQRDLRRGRPRRRAAPGRGRCGAPHRVPQAPAMAKAVTLNSRADARGSGYARGGQFVGAAARAASAGDRSERAATRTCGRHGSRATRSRSTSRAPTCAPCCARSPRSAG